MTAMAALAEPVAAESEVAYVAVLSTVFEPHSAAVYGPIVFV